MVWEDALKSLADTIAAYAKEAGLQFKSEATGKRWSPRPGESIGLIEGPNGARFYLEPAEFSEKKFPAVVWLFAYPSMRRVRLVGPFEGSRWEVASSDGVSFHQSLNPQTFIELIDALKHRAA